MTYLRQIVQRMGSETQVPAEVIVRPVNIHPFAREQGNSDGWGEETMMKDQSGAQTIILPGKHQIANTEQPESKEHLDASVPLLASAISSLIRSQEHRPDESKTEASVQRMTRMQPMKPAPDLKNEAKQASYDSSTKELNAAHQIVQEVKKPLVITNNNNILQVRSMEKVDHAEIREGNNIKQVRSGTTVVPQPEKPIKKMVITNKLVIGKITVEVINSEKKPSGSREKVITRIMNGSVQGTHTHRSKLSFGLGQL